MTPKKKWAIGIGVFLAFGLIGAILDDDKNGTSSEKKVEPQQIEQTEQKQEQEAEERQAREQKEEAERQAKEEAERQAREQKEEAERQAREQKEETERQAHEKDEKIKKVKEKAEYFGRLNRNSIYSNSFYHNLNIIPTFHLTAQRIAVWR